MLRLRVSIVALALLAAGGAAFAAGVPARAVPGNTLHGFEDDGEFYDYYAKDGSATSLRVTDGEVTHGRYTVEGGNICLNFPNDTPACYAVTGTPPAVILTDTQRARLFPRRFSRAIRRTCNSGRSQCLSENILNRRSHL